MIVWISHSISISVIVPYTRRSPESSVLLHLWCATGLEVHRRGPLPTDGRCCLLRYNFLRGLWRWRSPSLTLAGRRTQFRGTPLTDQRTKHNRKFYYSQKWETRFLNTFGYLAILFLRDHLRHPLSSPNSVIWMFYYPRDSRFFHVHFSVRKLSARLSFGDRDDFLLRLVSIYYRFYGQIGIA